MTVGPGTYAHRYIPKRNATRQGSQTTSSSNGSSSSSSNVSGHPYKRTQPGTSTSPDPPGNIGPNVSNCTLIGEIAPIVVPACRPNHTVQGALNPGALGPPNPRAEKRRFIQQHLVLILHAYQCRRKSLHEYCQLPHCSTFREVLGHMSSCPLEVACHFPHCTSSKQIYRHWKTCARADCAICVPIRLADRLERNHF